MRSIMDGLCVSVLLIVLAVLVNGHPSQNRLFKRDAVDVRVEAHSEEPYIYLTVSSLASDKIRDRLLELNWENLPRDVSDSDNVRINLYNKDPSTDVSAPLVSVIPTAKGYFRTSIRFPHQVFNKNNLTDACLGFWIAFLKNDSVLLTNCIRAHPHWMYDAGLRIANLSLMDLMIPGTHNTGSYARFDPDEDTIFNRYLFTQEEDIFNQLVHGIRYLDLRVAYHNDGADGSRQKFWITHSSFRIDTSIDLVFRQVKAFLNATKEIVIMDFHRFVTGFQNRRSPATRRRHMELIALLEQELGEFMIPVQYTSDVPLQRLWDTDKRLYVGYADERARSGSAYLFPAVKQLWGDVDEVDHLYAYLNDTVCKPGRRRLTSAMAQLTPTTAGVLFNVYGGLRKMADQVNRQVAKWFGNEWNQCANIIATDFFLGNNIIELAIRTNRKKLFE